ncbi:hypothetical protein ABZT03_43325 [Streptomyces sp. NPDC005574]|uniref:hypothetical protein n=1 Tax=Streptomyces sp. NPDC005574 TaxID=3156891 RepID=UPI0033BBF95B
MASVMGLLEEREIAARAAVEELQAEAVRVLAELGAAEAVLERRVIARAELAEALAAGDGAADPPRLEVQVPPPPAHVDKVPVTGATVVWHREGMTVEALAPEYRRIVELLQCEPGAGEGVSAKDVAARLGLELVPAKIEGVRSRAKRLVEREWLRASPSGRFMPRASAAPAAEN